MNNNQVSVHETFQEVIQGEGYWAGTPCDFIRLAGCPIACPWCDTGYADGGKNTPRSLRSIDELVKEVRSSRVVISGGEPFANKKLPDLVTALERQGHLVNIETSGAFWQPISKTAWVTMSPKQHVSHRYPVHPAMWLRADEIKVVISTGDELRHYQPFISHWWNSFTRADFLPYLDHLSRTFVTKQLYLQPEWNDRDRTLPLVLELLKKHPNYRLSLQLHKFIGVR